jgi:hypothetical protein
VFAAERSRSWNETTPFSLLNKMTTFYALYDFNGVEGELSFVAGDEIIVTPSGFGLELFTFQHHNVDRLLLLFSGNSSSTWASGTNKRTKKTGNFPLSLVGGLCQSRFYVIIETTTTTTTTTPKTIGGSSKINTNENIVENQTATTTTTTTTTTKESKQKCLKCECENFVKQLWNPLKCQTYEKKQH